MITASRAWDRVTMARSKLSMDGDKSFCSVLALSAISNISTEKINGLLQRRHGRGVQGWMLVDAAERMGFTAVLVPKIGRGMDWNIVNTAKKHGVDLTKGMHLVFSTGHVAALVDGELIDPWQEIKSQRVWAVYTLIRSD
jgi:hypothetical protein